MMRRLFSLLAPVLALVLAGCAGYQIGPIQPTIMKGVKTVAVPVFRNETLTPHLETLFTNALVHKLQQDGTYGLAGMNDADAILECTVTKIDRRSARSLRNNVLASSEYNLLVLVSYQLTRRDTGAQIDSRSVVGQTSFFVGADIQQDEQQALPIAIADAAAHIVSNISEGW